MEQNDYSKNLILTLAAINILIQIVITFVRGHYSLPLLIATLLVSFFIWQWLTKKNTQQMICNEVIQRATSFIDPLQQAITQKNLEEPLLARQNSNTIQLNTRLNISSLYLFLCIIGIRQSKGNTDYVKSIQFNTLLKNTKPVLQKIYLQRGTKTERVSELIQNNYQQIKQLITSYCQYIKKYNGDPTLPIQAWFEEKSRINLADKPYIFRSLAEHATDEGEMKLLQTLCRPKKHSKLLTKTREKTETFMALLNQSNRLLLQENEEALDYRYIEKYLSAFLLIFGLVIIHESNGNPNYIQSIEYKALRNKATMIIKSMILNSRYLGVESLDQTQTEHLVKFMEKQLPSVEMAYVDYFKATQHQMATPEIYLLDWFKATTKTTLSTKTDLPFKLNEYVQQILAEDLPSN